MKSTPSTVRSGPSTRMPAPLPSGTRARVRVRLRTVMLVPVVTSSALPWQVLSVSTTEAASPTPAMVRWFCGTVAQSKYWPGAIKMVSPSLASAMAAEGVA